jgi:hypothetical protein
MNLEEFRAYAKISNVIQVKWVAVASNNSTIINKPDFVEIN